MICLFLNYDQAGRTSRTERFKMRPRVCIHRGEVRIVNGQVQLLREDGVTVFARRSKCTLLDDSIQPPRIVREDYPIKKLKSLCKREDFPMLFTDSNDNVIDTRGKIIIEGPPKILTPV